jgi:hypothetical protein
MPDIAKNAARFTAANRLVCTEKAKAAQPSDSWKALSRRIAVVTAGTEGAGRGIAADI